MKRKKKKKKKQKIKRKKGRKEKKKGKNRKNSFPHFQFYKILTFASSFVHCPATFASFASRTGILFVPLALITIRRTR